MTYNNSIQFNPNHHYINVDFDSVKSSLISLPGELKDFGSIVIVDDIDYSASINNIGQVTVFYNIFPGRKIDGILALISSAFSKQDYTFRYYPHSTSLN